MLIRPECVDDVVAIDALTAEAFLSMPYSDGSESRIINDLRTDGDLTLSLVAIDEGEIVGHVAYSSVKINGVSCNWFGLGPISVHPQRQSSGIGSKLIGEGIRVLTDWQANGIVLVGDPEYYNRFGFVADGSLTYLDIPNELVQWFLIKGEAPTGELTYCRAFGS